MATPPAPSPPELLGAPALHHLAVVVSDLARSEAFYGGILGLEVVARHVDAEGAPRATWLRLGSGTAFLALERASVPAPGRHDGAPGLHCLALPIDPTTRELWRRHVAHRGYPVVRETSFTLYVRDPDGCLVALSHHPTPADL